MKDYVPLTKNKFLAVYRYDTQESTAFKRTQNKTSDFMQSFVKIY